MAASNEMIIEYQGQPRRTAAARTLAAGKKLFRGAIGMHVAGVAQPLVSGSALAALLTTVPGAAAGANAGVTFRPLRSNLRVSHAGGTSQSLRVISITYGATYTDIAIGLATDNADAVTTTAAAYVAFWRSHGLLSALSLVKATGDGTGLCATASVTALVFAGVLGWSDGTYDNAAGGSDLAVPMMFHQGCARVAPGSPAVTSAMLGAQVGLYDDITATAAPGPLDFTAELTNVDSRGAVYARIGN